MRCVFYTEDIQRGVCVCTALTTANILITRAMCPVVIRRTVDYSRCADDDH